MKRLKCRRRSVEVHLSCCANGSGSCTCRKRDGQNHKLLRLWALRLGITCRWLGIPMLNLKFRTTDLIFNVDELRLGHRDAAKLAARWLQVATTVCV